MFKLTPVLVKRIPSRNDLDRRINDAMNDWNALNEEEFDSTASTFQSYHPNFMRETSFSPSHKEVGVGTDDKIYEYLNDGTSVRYATMGPRFRAKTAPKRIKAGPGQSDVLYVNKNRPRPGIKARNFDKQIKKKLEPEYFKLVSRAVLSFVEDF